ncbi:MAG: alpha/beta fold hydrolase [Clostridia bacterium]|nr:alpha/beta fold hydrolase [Clostridia bacterium]
MTERKNTARRIRRALTVTLVIILVLSVMNLVAAKIIYDSLFPRYEYTDYYLAKNPSNSEMEEAYPIREVGFLSDENRLQGYIYGEGDKGLVVISPGLSSGAQDYAGITMSLVDYGWRVFSFDPTGCFESEGDSSVGFAQAILDLDAVLNYIETDKELSKLDVFIFGHSRGGYAAACVLESDHSINGIVTVGAANSSMEITIDTSKNYIGNFAYLGYPALYTYQAMIFGTELTSITAVDSINNSDCSVMIVQGSEDDNTPADTCSIYAHKDEITNPLASFVLISDEHINGHTSVMYSKDAAIYQQEISDELDALEEQYPEGIPENVAQDFYSSIDDMLSSEANPELMAQINEFFEANLSR